MRERTIKVKQQQRDWYLRNRDKEDYQTRSALNCIKWRQNNIEKLLLSRARVRARQGNLPFDLELSDIQIPETCPLLGVPLGNKYKDPDVHADYVPSIDRKDNSKGYTKDNIWIISFKANRMKNTASVTELITFSKSILNTFEDLE